MRTGKKYWRLIISLLTLLTLVHELSAQVFADSSKIFYQWNEPTACPAPCRFITTTIFRFREDTLIGNNHFMKIFYSEDSLQTPMKVAGFIRETAGRVYAKSIYGDNCPADGGMMYDFSLMPGDTMIFCNPFLASYHDSLKLVQLDTVVIFDSLRKVFHLKSLSGIRQGDNWEDLWIEGIGSLIGPLFSGFPCNPWTGSIQILLCVYQHDQLIYSDPEHNSCYYNTTDVETPEKDQIHVRITPNPVSGISLMTITGSHGKTYILEIYSRSGCLLKKNKLTEEQPFRLQAKEFVPGLYFFRLTDNYSPAFTGKFVVIGKKF